MNMKEKLKILLVEDTPSDVKLLENALQREFMPEITIVQTADEFRKCLAKFDGDLIISDYSLPRFSGMRALKIKKQIANHLPFLLVTGSINEETAVEVMKAGADDYVIKEHLSRLNNAVKSALLKRKTIKEREEAEIHFRNIFENSLVGLYRTTPSGKILLANPALLQMLGYNSLNELTKRNLEKEGYAAGYSRAKFKKQMRESGEAIGFESAWKTKSGEIIFVAESARAIKDSKGKILYYEGVVENITGKKRAEESLKESTRKFNTMIDNLSGIVYRCLNDAGWTMEYISEAILDLTGFLSIDFTSKKVSYNNLIHPDDREYVRSEVQKALKKKKSFVLEYRIKTAENELKWVWEKGRGVFEKNNLLALEGFITDITDRKIAEEKINASEKKFRALIEKSNEAFALVDMTGRLLYVSPSVEKLYGYRAEDILNKNGFDFIHPDDIPSISERFIQLIKSPDGSTEVTCRFKHKNGNWLISEIFSTNLLHDPEVGAIVVNYHDITEKRRADEAIKNAAEKYRSIVEGTRAILFSTNKKGIFTYVNEAACQVFGLPEKEIVGKFYLKFVHRDAREEIHKLFSEQLVSPTPNTNIEVRITTNTIADGWLNLLVNPVRENGSIIGLTAVALDVTEKITASRALKQKYDHLQLLNALSAELQGILDLKEMIQKAYRVIPRYLNFDRTSIFMYDKVADGLISDKFIGEDIEIPIAEVQTLNIGISGKCFREMDVISIDDCAKTKIIPKQFVQSLQLKSTVAIPLKAEGRAIGVMRLDHTSRKYSFSVEDLEFYDLLGNQLGIILRNAQLFTEQIKISSALRESEKRFRDVVETANEGIIVTDSMDNITFANKKFAQMLGHGVDELINMNYTKLLPEEDKQLFIKYNTERRLGVPGVYEQKLNMKAGGCMFAIVSASPIIDDEGKFQGSFGMFTDITDRKLAAERLLESERSYIGLFNSVTEAIYIQDVEGNFIDVNQGAVNMYGYSHPEFIGRTPAFLSAPALNDKLIVPEMLKTVFTTGAPVQFEFWGRRKNGEIFPKEVICNKGRYFGKEVLIVTARDITERKRAEKILNKRLELEKTISSISSRFISVGPNELDSEINIALKQVGKITESDRSYLFYFSDDLSTFTNTHEWCSEGITEQKDNMQNVPTGQFLWWMKQMKELNTIHIPDVDRMPAEAANDKSSLKTQEIQSLLVVPLVSANKLIGFVGFDSVRIKKTWAEEDIIVLKILSEIFSNTISRINSESALKQSEEKYRSIFETAVEGICGINQDSIIKYCNPQFANMLGYTVDELTGSKFQKLVPQIELEDYEDKIEERKKGKRDIFERQLTRKDGRVIITKVAVAPNHEDNGNYVGSFGMFTDITEEKKREAEVRKLSLGIEQNSASVVITDPKGTIEYVNPHFTKVTGYALQEAIGKNPRILQSGQTPREVYVELWNTILSGNVWRGEFLNKKKNGELFWESVLISPMKNEKNLITNFIAIKEDITEKKKMIEELRQAKEKAEEMNRVKSSFFANMSHELRTPLIGILGYSEIMQEDTKLSKDYVSMAKNMNRGGKRLLETVNMILNISKINSDKQEARFEKIDIVAIVRETVNLFKAAALKKNLALNLFVKEETIICYADEKLLCDVFNNLVNNAIKFTEAGSVAVEIEIESKHVVIRVADTGIGIPQDKQGIIWEEFRQSSEGMGRSFEGTGLGLTISKKYVELMGGTISLESAEGKGSTFKVEFPTVD